MDSEDRGLGPVYRVTSEPHRTADISLDCVYDKNGDGLFVQAIEDEKHVDLRDESMTADVYWAEGWILDFARATRTDLTFHDDKPVRMYPVRYRVADFDLSRRFRRVLKRNEDVRCVVRPLRLTPAKDELYKVHCYSRFQDYKGALSRGYKYIVHHDPPLRELTMFGPDGRLIAFSIIEIGTAASYGRLTAWSPDERHRSLGTFAMLKAIEYARERGFKYHYVGPTYLADRAFNYKLRYPACEVYDWERNEWYASDSAKAIKLLNAPLRRRRWSFTDNNWVGWLAE
jgi:leucyl-tRNA---protein transferase